MFYRKKTIGTDVSRPEDDVGWRVNLKRTERKSAKTWIKYRHYWKLVIRAVYIGPCETSVIGIFW